VALEILENASALAAPACAGLEFDVRVSRDGVPIVLHDPTLARVQGDPRPAADVTAAELAALGVPDLASVLALAMPLRESETAPFLDVELKELPGDAFLEVLGAGRGEGRDQSSLRRAVVSSFHPDILAWLARVRPDWPRWGNARDLSARVVGLAAELGCSAIAVEWRGIDRAGIERAWAAGLEVAAWTVRRRSSYARLARLGVIAICAEAAALDG